MGSVLPDMAVHGPCHLGQLWGSLGIDPPARANTVSDDIHGAAADVSAAEHSLGTAVSGSVSDQAIVGLRGTMVAVPHRSPWADEDDEELCDENHVVSFAPPSPSEGGIEVENGNVLKTGSSGTLADVPFAEQALTAAPSFNLKQRRAIGAILAQDSGGQLHADLRKLTLGRLELGDYLHMLDGHIQILQNAFQQAELQVEADVVRQYVDLRSVLAL